jgi:aspartate racemase
MKRLGVIGGIGPESTVIYYRALLAAGARRLGGAAPPLIINSIDVGRLLGLFERKAFAELADYLVVELDVLARAGASLGIIAANTPHIVLAQVRERSPLPLVSIVEATRDAARSRGFARLALFGTRFTMAGHFYDDVFAGSAIALIRPNDDEQAFIHEIYVGELLKGVIRPDTRDRLLAIVQTMTARDGIDGVILAGTELSLILTPDLAAAVPLVDTTAIHVQAAIDALWG